MQSLEPEYLALVERFDSSAEVFFQLAMFYQLLGHKNLDEAVEAAEKAVAMDNKNVAYATTLANLLKSS